MDNEIVAGFALLGRLTLWGKSTAFFPQAFVPEASLDGVGKKLLGSAFGRLFGVHRYLTFKRLSLPSMFDEEVADYWIGLS